MLFIKYYLVIPSSIHTIFTLIIILDENEDIENEIDMANDTFCDAEPAIEVVNLDVPENVEPEPGKGGQEDYEDFINEMEEPLVDVLDKRNTFSCEKCTYTERTKYALARHMKVAHKEDTFSCFVCSKPWPTGLRGNRGPS